MLYHYEVGRDKIPLDFNYPAYLDTPDSYYEPEIVEVIERFLEPGDFAIDGGASFGWHTCLMSKLVGETGLVLAFEPEQRSFIVLQQHIHELNKLNNVGAIRAALWKEDCEGLRLWSVEAVGYSSFHRYDDATSELVDGLAIDSIANQVAHPRLIKLDCEGVEADILSGGVKTLEKGVDAVIVELNYHLFEQTGRSDKDIRGPMAQLGYDMFILGVGSQNDLFRYRKPIMVPPTVPIKLQGASHINVLFSTEEKVRKRWPTT